MEIAESNFKFLLKKLEKVIGAIKIKGTPILNSVTKIERNVYQWLKILHPRFGCNS
jgi:hypothetical protein